jgi:hypothetical protein
MVCWITSSILQYYSAFFVSDLAWICWICLYIIPRCYAALTTKYHIHFKVSWCLLCHIWHCQICWICFNMMPTCITHGQLSIVSIISHLVLFMSDSVVQNLPHPPLCNVQIVCWIDKCVLYPFHSILVPFVSDSVLPNLPNLPLCDIQMVC